MAILLICMVMLALWLATLETGAMGGAENSAYPYSLYLPEIMNAYPYPLPELPPTIIVPTSTPGPLPTPVP